MIIATIWELKERVQQKGDSYVHRESVLEFATQMVEKQWLGTHCEKLLKASRSATVLITAKYGYFTFVSFYFFICYTLINEYYVNLPSLAECYFECDLLNQKRSMNSAHVLHVHNCIISYGAVDLRVYESICYDKGKGCPSNY